jgi:hypothetical protein
LGLGAIAGSGSGNAASGSKGFGKGVSIISGSVCGISASGVTLSAAEGCKRFKKPSALGFSDFMGMGTGLITGAGVAGTKGSAVEVGSSIEAGGSLGITGAFSSFVTSG